MKLILAVVRSDDFLPITQALNEAGFAATYLGSTGAYLALRNVTILCGVEDQDVDDALHIIRKHAKAHNFDDSGDPMDLANISGTVVFVTDVVRYEKLGKSSQ